MERQGFSGHRWLGVALRAVHLVAVIWLGAALLGAPVEQDRAVLGLWLSGLGMLALDTWNKPSHLREASGIAVLVKLAVVAWMAADESSRAFLFWFVVAGSALFSHAPARFRHATPFARSK